jgi:hypothetical protein
MKTAGFSMQACKKRMVLAGEGNKAYISSLPWDDPLLQKIARNGYINAGWDPSASISSPSFTTPEDRIRYLIEIGFHDSALWLCKKNLNTNDRERMKIILADMSKIYSKLKKLRKEAECRAALYTLDPKNRVNNGAMMRLRKKIRAEEAALPLAA